MSGFLFYVMYNRGMKNTSGFTVMELLIVIAMLLILMAIVLSSLGLSQKRTRDDRRVSTLQEIMLALEQYRDVCREYPHSLGLNVSNGCATGGNIDNSANVNLGSFLSNDVQEVITNNTFSIRYAGITSMGQLRCTGYHIGIPLETTHPELSRADRFNSDGIPLGEIDAEICQPNTSGGFSGDTDNCSLFFPGGQGPYKCLDFKKGNP
jgi:prepilin-type N-terminal cleavage/methylation domain-containing protein